MFNKKEVEEKLNNWIFSRKYSDVSELREALRIKEKLEEVAFFPHKIVVKDNKLLALSYFAKGDWTKEQKKNGIRYTGFDAYKYYCLKLFESKTGINTAIVIYKEEGNEIKFAQLNSLGKPEIWFNDKWQQREKYRNPDKKKAAMAMWPVENLQDVILIQDRLF